MIVFIDVEASALGPRGYPIEVGWATVEGSEIISVESMLVRPTDTWRETWEWSEASAGVHGISREQLDRDGHSVDAICRRLVDELAGLNTHSDNAVVDGVWLGRLFAAWRGDDVIVSIDALPIRMQEAVVLWMPPSVSLQVCLHAEAEIARHPIRHRAGDDAYLSALRYAFAKRYDLEHGLSGFQKAKPAAS